MKEWRIRRRMAAKNSINLRLDARNGSRQARAIGKLSKIELLIQAGAFGKQCLLESLIQENFGPSQLHRQFLISQKP